MSVSTPGPRAAIEKLPSELLTSIVSYLCSHCDHVPLDEGVEGENRRDKDAKNDLAALCKTSRRLADHAQPFLYHRPVVNVKRFHAFLRTLKNCPHLATEVKDMKNVTCFHRIVEYDWDPKFYQDISRFIDFKLPSEEGDEDPSLLWIELLIPLLPNLDTLFLEVNNNNVVLPPWRLDKWTSRFAKMRSFPGFSTLRHLKLNNLNRRDGVDDRRHSISLGAFEMQNLLSAFPNLEALTLYNIKSLEDGHGSIAKLEPIFNNLRTLEFLDSTFQDFLFLNGDLERLLALCPGLEAFRCNNKGIYNADMYPISPRQFTQALKRNSATLKHLDLDTSTTFPSVARVHYIEWFVDSDLQSFEVLETLRLDEKSVCRHWVNGIRAPYKLRRPSTLKGPSAYSKLPSLDKYMTEQCDCLTSIVGKSLRWLQIQLADCSVLGNDLAKLALHVKIGKYPSLRRVSVFRTHKQSRRRDDPISQEFAAISEDFKSGGVDFEVLPYGTFKLSAMYGL